MSDPQVYANGEPVIIRGIERRQEQYDYGPDHAKTGEWGTFIYVHVDFVEEPDEHTHDVPLQALSIEGGAPALNDYLLERGLVPEWWVKNEPVPDTLDKEEP